MTKMPEMTPEQEADALILALERFRVIKVGKNETDNPLDSLDERQPPPLPLDEKSVDPKTGAPLYVLRNVALGRENFISMFVDFLRDHVFLPREAAVEAGFNLIREQKTPRRNVSKLSSFSAIRREMAAIYRESYAHGTDAAPYYTKLMYMLDCIMRAAQMEMAARKANMVLEEGEDAGADALADGDA
ncbi:MAG: hypothetical protein AB7G06_09635 [Bdellovibrionales bacterium]